MKSSVKEIKFFFAQQTTEEPLIDMYETGDELVFEIDLPGINPDDVSIKVFDDLFTIEGIMRERDCTVKAHRYLCMERSMESFRRAVKIPVSVDIFKGRAEYVSGVITVIFPKVTEKKVEIKIEVRKGD